MSVAPSRFLLGRLPWYSVLIVIGAALAIWLAAREKEKYGLPKGTMVDLALRVLPVGILGARLYYVLFSWSAYRDNPVSMLYIWEGGLAIYGGLIAGFLCVWIFCRRRKLSLLTVCDALIPGVALAQAIGRWGNYFNQEAYGRLITTPGLCFFPLGVQIAGSAGLEWHMATFFYESVLDFGIFLFLRLRWDRMRSHRGDTLFTYLFLYGAARLIVENFRMDSLYAGTVRVSQLLSVVLCAGLLGMMWRRARSAGARFGGAEKAMLGLAGAAAVALLLYCCGGLRVEGTGRQLALLGSGALLMTVTYIKMLEKKEGAEAKHANDPT